MTAINNAIAPGGNQPIVPVPAAVVQTTREKIAHGIKVGGYAIYNILRTCLPDLAAVGIAGGVGIATGIGGAGAAVRIGAGAITGPISGIIRHSINTFSAGGLRDELIPGMLQSVLFRGLFRALKSNPLPLKGGAVAVEYFSQVTGDFYRNLCRHGMANAGVCASLCREWMKIRKDCSFLQNFQQVNTQQFMQLYISGLKGTRPNTLEPSYIANQLITTSSDILYPQLAVIRQQGLIDDTFGPFQTSHEFASNVAIELLSQLQLALGNGQNNPVVFADISMASLPSNHATCLSMSERANGIVDIDYFDVNFGQFRISCPRGQVVNQFTEFFTDFMARTSYSVGFSNFNYRIMQ